MSVYAPIKLCQAVLTASDATYYTVPGSTSVIIKEITLVNTTATSATVTISIVPSAGSPAVGNRLFEQVPVSPYTTVIISDLSEVLPTGEFLSAKASAATTITMRASGVTVV
jgi:hypothetical protein